MYLTQEDITIDEGLEITGFTSATLESLRTEPSPRSGYGYILVKSLATPSDSNQAQERERDGKVRSTRVPDKKARRDGEKLREDIASRVLRDMRTASPEGDDLVLQPPRGNSRRRPSSWSCLTPSRIHFTLVYCCPGRAS